MSENNIDLDKPTMLFKQDIKNSFRTIRKTIEGVEIENVGVLLTVKNVADNTTNCDSFIGIRDYVYSETTLFIPNVTIVPIDSETEIKHKLKTFIYR